MVAPTASEVTNARDLFASAAAYLTAQQFTDAGRTARGLALAQQPGAVTMSATECGAWLVRSECGHRHYVVRTGAGTCDCADATQRGTYCKHRAAVLAYSMVYDELRFRALNARALAATRQPCTSRSMAEVA